MAGHQFKTREVITTSWPERWRSFITYQLDLLSFALDISALCWSGQPFDERVSRLLRNITSYGLANVFRFQWPPATRSLKRFRRYSSLTIRKPQPLLASFSRTLTITSVTVHLILSCNGRWFIHRAAWITPLSENFYWARRKLINYVVRIIGNILTLRISAFENHN